MDSELYKLQIKAQMGQQYFKVKASRQELEQNYPHKVELIESMKESELELLEIQAGIRIFCDALTSLDKRTFQLEALNLKLEVRNQELEKLNQSLTEKVNL